MYTIPKAAPDTFDFQLEGEETVYSVPVLRELPLETVLKAEELKDNASDLEALTYIKSIFDEYAPGAVDRLSVEQFAFLFKAYMGDKNNDTTLGE